MMQSTQVKTLSICTYTAELDSGITLQERYGGGGAGRGFVCNGRSRINGAVQGFAKLKTQENAQFAGSRILLHGTKQRILFIHILYRVYPIRSSGFLLKGVNAISYGKYQKSRLRDANTKEKMKTRRIKAGSITP